MHANGRTVAKHMAQMRRRAEKRRTNPKGIPIGEIGHRLFQDQRFATVRDIEAKEGRAAGKVAAMCTTKIAYETAADAQAAIDERRRVRALKDAKIYQCPHCGMFHIAHRQKKGAQSR